MSAIREQYLSLREVEGYVREFEEKYKMSSAEFLSNSNPDVAISEDDAFEWEAFIAQRRELQSLDQQRRRTYLSALRHRPHNVRKPTRVDQVSFAA